jgi:hypothetical protein
LTSNTASSTYERDRDLTLQKKRLRAQSAAKRV